MGVVHLNQKQLAARWYISEATLERWRWPGAIAGWPCWTNSPGANLDDVVGPEGANPMDGVSNQGRRSR